MQEECREENSAKKTFTREELYELVWKIPMRKLARRFGISDVGLAKVCRRHNIPTPQVGYWAKKQHGKTVRRISLPPSDDPALTTIRFTHSNEAAVSEKTPPPASLASTFFDPELGRLAEVEAHGENSIVVTESLRSPHPLVARTRDGLAASSKEKPSYYRYPVLRPRSVGTLCCLDVHVGKAHVGRAMRIMDALIKGLEDRGYRVSVPDQHWQRGTLVEAMGHHFQIRLREHSKHQARIPTERERQEIARYPHAHSVSKWEYAPTGRLLLELLEQYGYSIFAIRDGEKRRIEDVLFKIPMAILRYVDKHRRQASIDAEKARVRAEIDRQQREEQERRRLEEKKRQEELARVEALFAEAANWNRCRQLQDYLEALHTMVNERYVVEPDSPLDRWLKWADGVVEQSNPLTTLRKEIDRLLGVSSDAEVTSTSVPKPR